MKAPIFLQTGSIPLTDSPVPVKWQARLRLFCVVNGKLEIYEQATLKLEPDVRLQELRFMHDFRPKQRRLGGDYMLRVDVIDPERPDVSQLRDARLLEVVPRKAPKPPQARDEMTDVRTHTPLCR